MQLFIKYLADVPEVIPTLAKWTHDSWAKYDPGLTLERATESFQDRLSYDDIPFTIVALDGEKPVGMASLKEAIRVPGYENKFPWLGSFYVDSAYRDMGVGTQLLSVIYNDAKKLGYKKLYLFTSEEDSVPWYELKGWVKFKTDTYHGRPITLMSVDLA